MLKIDINWTDEDGPPEKRLVLVANVGGGRVANYRVQVADRTPTSDPVEIRGYPRWSEPLIGFVARALEVVLPSLDVPGTSLVTGYRCTTSIVPYGRGTPRVLFDLTAERVGQRYVVSLAQDDQLTVWRRFRTVVRPPVALLLRTLSRLTWQANRVPPVPAPLALEVHVDQGTRYIRESDIPPWVAPAFALRSRGQTRPVVPSEQGACIYAWDWDAFLG